MGISNIMTWKASSWSNGRARVATVIIDTQLLLTRLYFQIPLMLKSFHLLDIIALGNEWNRPKHSGIYRTM